MSTANQRLSLTARTLLLYGGECPASCHILTPLVAPQVALWQRLRFSACCSASNALTEEWPSCPGQRLWLSWRNNIVLKSLSVPRTCLHCTAQRASSSACLLWLLAAVQLGSLSPELYNSSRASLMHFTSSEQRTESLNKCKN
jgi:hypothetical protein